MFSMGFELWLALLPKLFKDHSFIEQTQEASFYSCFQVGMN